MRDEVRNSKGNTPRGATEFGAADGTEIHNLADLPEQRWPNERDAGDDVGVGTGVSLQHSKVSARLPLHSCLCRHPPLVLPSQLSRVAEQVSHDERNSRTSTGSRNSRNSRNSLNVRWNNDLALSPLPTSACRLPLLRAHAHACR